MKKFITSAIIIVGHNNGKKKTGRSTHLRTNGFYRNDG